ncbi:MAG TPA: hypothetical protein VIS96_12325 [Terrimicrobiaceae bacterium]
MRFEIGKPLLHFVLRGLIDPVDLAGHLLAFLFEVALGAFLFLRGGAQVGLALGLHPVAFDLLLLLEVLVDFLSFLLRELLGGERFGLCLAFQSFLFLVRFGEISAVNHVKLLLRDTFILQLAVGLLRIVTKVGMLLLQRRNGAFTEVHVGSRRCLFFGWQGFGRLFRGGGRWRMRQIVESRNYGALVDQHDAHYVSTHVLRLLVAFEIVHVLKGLWCILFQRILELQLCLALVGHGRGTVSDDIYLVGVAFRLPVARWDHDSLLGLV